MKIKKLLSAVSLLAVLAVLTGALASCTVLSSTSREKETVMTVGEYEVPYELYYYISNQLKAEMPDATDEELEAEIFSMLREIFAVFSLAEDYGIAYDDEYIASIADDAAQLAIEECGSKSEYKKALSENYMNDSVFRFLKKHSQTADELLLAISKSGEYPSDEEGMTAVIMSDEFVRVKQILVVGENSISSDDTIYKAGADHTDEEALAIAEKARSKALAGEDFDRLVNEYGESLYMFNNTDGYYVCRGMWEEANEDAVFALKVGEVSEVVESEVGYSVFLRCEKDSEYVAKNIDSITSDYYSAQYNLLVNERMEELEIKTNEVYDSYVNGEAAK